MNPQLQRLFEKAIVDQLHHLYIVQNTWNLPEDEFLKFINPFIEKYHFHFTQKTISPDKFINCQDLLFLNPSIDEKNFTPEDIHPLFQFLNYKSSQYPRRIVVIPCLHKLTDIVINKLLKILEEPPVPVTIFILNPHNVKILPTLESRAIKLKWGEFRLSESEDAIPSIQHVYELQDMIKNDGNFLNTLFKNLLFKYGQRPQDGKALKQLQKLIQQYEISKTYHNSNFHIALETFNFLKNN